MKRFVAKHFPLFILAALCLALALTSPSFRSIQNLKDVPGRTCVIGVIALGELLVILVGGIDLSVGSVAALAGVVAALVMKQYQAPVLVGILTGVAVGALCGLINGLLTTRGRIPAFIATLGMMMGARGIAMILCGSVRVSGLPESFRYLGGTKIIGEIIPGQPAATTWWIPVLFALGLGIFFSIMLSHTRFGRSLYAIGGNLQASRLSGIPADGARTWAFALCGMMAGFAGVMLASRTTLGDPTAAESYELDAIAACVIGGASLMGGEGGALAALGGALIIMVLRNFCNLTNIDANWQKVIVGGLLVALVFYDTLRKRKAGLLKDG